MEDTKRKDETIEERVKECDEACQHNVKSRAIVKYSTVNSPAHFAQLECNTDLKPPPSNWLFSSTKNYGLHHPVYKSNGFTSFRLAHMYSDCIGEVDVVSDAENIKKLLKIPYNKAPVSMMVHRIENTLLIDEFDIHKHLLLQAENDWQWLRKFFFENVIQSLPRRNFSIGHKSTRSSLQQKSLVSKFLHYSFGETGKDSSEINEAPIKWAQGKSPQRHLVCSTGPVLPEPEPDEGLPDSGNDYKFIRNVVWSFEDIQMLLGTDMPIFGGTTHPCISLRLRDIEKPISVLTGIDYWLDNLMSNVPEVVMCYHLDGIVQKYELIKTEDLPHHTDPKFSPELIRDVAQNILSFLKSNATKAGHTYWLFKGRNDDVVKLYDLSSLCSESLVDNKEQNPFTVPVGLLFYRVARNMKQSKEQTQPSTIRMLLKNCLALLPKEKYPQIVTSAHYMLSDIYIPFDTDPSSPHLLDEICSADDQNNDEEDDDLTRTQVAVKSLCIANYITERETKYHPPPLVGSVTERCMSSLSHVAQGLDCLQYFSNIHQNKKNEMKEEPKMAKSSEPIPMPYSKLPDQYSNSENDDLIDSDDSSLQADLKSVNALLCRPKIEPIPSWQGPDKMDNQSWKIHLEDLLVKKACLVYRTLAEQHFTGARYGLSLRCVSRYVDLCKVGPMEIFNLPEIASMMRKAGDCCFHIAKSWNKVDDYLSQSSETIPSLADFFKLDNKDYINSDLLDIPSEITSIKDMLLSSKACYLKALKLLDHEDPDLLTRIGNIYNEIGIVYINQAYELFQAAQQDCRSMDEVEKMLKKAEVELKSGVKIFEKLSDSKNFALLLSNLGKLYRLRALQYNKIPQLQKENNQKAEDSYLEALKILGSRKDHPEIWDAVNWELSSFLFQQASYLQESRILHKTIDEISREVIDLCNKCLKYCDLTTNEHRLLLYQYRAARLHHMLASIFHRQYRTIDDDDNRRKMVLKLCQNHLLKSTNLFQAAESYSDLLSVYLERISLHEFQASEVNGNHVKMKFYQLALSLLCELKPVLVELNSTFKTNYSNKGEDSTSTAEDDNTEEIKLLTLDKIVCSILKDILVINIKSKSSPNCLRAYKESYGLLLKRTSTNSTIIDTFLTVIDLLSQVTESKTKK